jgi:hypothetical protein
MGDPGSARLVRPLLCNAAPFVRRSKDQCRTELVVTQNPSLIDGAKDHTSRITDGLSRSLDDGHLGLGLAAVQQGQGDATVFCPAQYP